MEKPTILWHLYYENGPINGLARYQEEYFWYDCCDKGSTENLDDVDKLPVFKLDENSDSDESCDFQIEESSEESILRSKRQFNLHRLDPEVVTKIIDEHERWKNEVGYHAEHDPTLYKPFRYQGDKAFFYQHIINYDEIKGEVAYQFNEDDFNQYDIPRHINPESLEVK